MVSGRYLDIFLDYLGCIPFDRKMHESVRQQQVMVDLYPDSKVSKSFLALADNVIEAQVDNQAQGTLQFFWKQFLGVNTEVS